MRIRSATLFAVLLALTPGVVREAQAAIAVELVWTSTTGAGTTGGSSIDAAPGDQLVAEIRITPDSGGVAAYAVSLEFDTDLGDELNLVSFTEFLPAGMQASFSPGAVESAQESTGAQKGNVLTYESVTLSIAGPTSGTFVAGQVTFDVTANVTSDGNDVFVGPFNANADGVGNNANVIVSPVFSGAAVNQVAAVPTLSAWGMISMTLLLLTAGTIAWLRRPASD